MNPQCEINVIGRRFDLTEAIKGRVEAMAAKLLEHDGRIDRIRVDLDLERHAASHQDEFSAKGWIDDGKERPMATARGDQLYAVIADLERKLDRLVRRIGKRRVSRRRRVKPIELAAELPKVGATAA